MATIKSYTDIEQSKKLAEILSLESADACWTNHLFGSILSSWRVESTPPQEYKSLLDRFAVRGYLIEPAWSLAALRNILPVGIEINENAYLFESHNTFDNSWVYRYYNEDDTSYLYCKNTSEINACVEMIIKLHELKML